MLVWFIMVVTLYGELLFGLGLGFSVLVGY